MPKFSRHIDNRGRTVHILEPAVLDGRGNPQQIQDWGCAVSAAMEDGDSDRVAQLSQAGPQAFGRPTYGSLASPSLASGSGSGSAVGSGKPAGSKPAASAKRAGPMLASSAANDAAASAARGAAGEVSTGAAGSTGGCGTTSGMRKAFLDSSGPRRPASKPAAQAFQIPDAQASTQQDVNMDANAGSSLSKKRSRPEAEHPQPAECSTLEHAAGSNGSSGKGSRQHATSSQQVTNTGGAHDGKEGRQQPASNWPAIDDFMMGNGKGGRRQAVSNRQVADEAAAGSAMGGKQPGDDEAEAVRRAEEAVAALIMEEEREKLACKGKRSKAKAKKAKGAKGKGSSRGSSATSPPPQAAALGADMSEPAQTGTGDLQHCCVI